MRPRRRHERFVRRLETQFSADGQDYRAISSDFSCSGLFIRTNHAFQPGTIVDIVVHLPDGKTSRLKGKVRRAIKTTVVSIKNGMGIEITEKDAAYSEFMSTFTAECEKIAEADPANAGRDRSDERAEVKAELKEAPEFVIVLCPSCGVKNKIPGAKVCLAPKCGRCGSPLNPQTS